MNTITRDIKCAICAHEGKVDAVDVDRATPPSKIFNVLGKDSSGYLHFRCPSCGSDLVVDPYEVIGARQMVGQRASRVSRHRSRANVERYVHVTLTAVLLVIAAFLVHNFSGWWVYVLAGALVLPASLSFWIALFGSKK